MPLLFGIILPFTLQTGANLQVGQALITALFLIDSPHAKEAES